jgi:AAA+ superfamily predicted ATPase
VSAGTGQATVLGDALQALESVAVEAGVAADVARAEGAALAAAVAESATGAAGDWAAATGGGSTRDFFDAAVRGRRWRSSPTATLTLLVAAGSPSAASYARALTEVASAACDLGEPTMRVVGNASVAAAAQLQATRARRTTGPGREPHAVAPPAGTRPGRTAPVTPSSPSTDGTAGTAADADAPALAQNPPVAARPVQELLDDLDALIGLRTVKREVHRQVALLRIEKLRAEAGLRSPTLTRHLVFTGNPGTGKTTVARLVAGIYHSLGLLSTGQLVEVDRSELVAGYLGQTAVKTAEVVQSAAGGVLFIDEAYALAGDQYGAEAVDTLVKEMEDRRDDLVVIVAGYPAPMATFVAANPGLSSRFRTTVEFEDYTDEELEEILVHLAAGADYELVPAAVARFRELLAATPRGASFGNGRFARNVLEAAIGRHAWRLRDVEAPTTDQLRQLLAEDLEDDSVEDHPVEDHLVDDHPVEDHPVEPLAPGPPAAPAGGTS